MIRGYIEHRRRAGQSTTETILLLPLYFLLVFGLLQMGQLVTALLVTNYGAASIARQIVQDGTLSSTGPNSLSDPRYIQKFKDLMVAGMKYNSQYGLMADRETDSSTGQGSNLLSNVTVHACAQVSAFPFVAELLLKPALGNRYAGAGCDDNAQSLGPFFFKGSPPYSFIVHGKATARMNYQPS